MYSAEWKEILDKIDDFAVCSSGIVWYRGHNDAGYALTAGLFRLPKRSLAEYLAAENKVFNYYKNLGYLLHGLNSGWEILYSMQHHGVRTRLLDWTESLAAALYFAAWGWERGNACIWLLDPIKLNELSLGMREIVVPHDGWRKYPEIYLTRENINSAAIYPVRNTKRINSQQGMFTIQGNTGLPLELEFKNAGERILLKIVLPLGLRGEILRFVKQNGVNHFTLFPDLDGLACYLNMQMERLSE